MTDDTTADGLRARLGKQGEETLARIAQELLESPLVTGALQRGLEAREKAAQAQEAAMGALNIPSAADLERLTRRVRSVGQRLEGIEDGVDRLSDRIAGGGGAADRLQALEGRLAALDSAIAEIAGAIAQLSAQAPADAPASKPSSAATGAKPPAKRRPTAKRKQASRAAARKPAG